MFRSGVLLGFLVLKSSSINGMEWNGLDGVGLRGLSFR